MGLQRETVSRGVTGQYVQALFAVALEGLFLGVVPSLLSVLGAAIIISSAIYVVVSDYLRVACCKPFTLIPPLVAGKARAVELHLR
jgi:drug/metabolite transporter (DMT)-like permease